MLLSCSIDDKDEDDSIVAVSENDVPRGEKMSERMDTPLLPMFETTIKRVSNQVKDKKPSPAFTTSVSNSMSPSYGCSANYGNDSERSRDSMQLSYDSEINSVENAS